MSCSTALRLIAFSSAVNVTIQHFTCRAARSRNLLEFGVAAREGGTNHDSDAKY
jgi:hypothetical protein